MLKLMPNAVIEVGLKLYVLEEDNYMAMNATISSNRRTTTKDWFTLIPPMVRVYAASRTCKRIWGQKREVCLRASRLQFPESSASAGCGQVKITALIGPSPCYFAV